MRTIKGVVLVLSFLIAALPGALWAQSPAGTGGKPTSYAVLKAGGYIPESSDMNKENASNGFAGRIGFGYYAAPYLSVEAAFGYQEFKGNRENVETKYQIIPLEISVRLGLPGVVEPYLMGGLGGYSVWAKAGNLEKNSIQVGFFGGGGVNFNLGDSFFIGVEAQYLFLQASQPTVTPFSASETNVNLDGLMVTGNLGFRF